jgi:hypothetical protein
MLFSVVDWSNRKFRDKCVALEGNVALHRKQLEFATMVAAIEDHLALGPHSRGIGFAVGSEPLGSYFVGKYRLSVTLTDMPPVRTAAAWNATGQHASSLAATFRESLVPRSTYFANAAFRFIDMSHIPEDLLQGEYDFLWSSSSLEHVGTIQGGIDFVVKSMKALKPGGVAVHTTEFSLSGVGKEDPGNICFWTKADVDRLGDALSRAGYALLPVQYELCKGCLAEYLVDTEPYHREGHMKLLHPLGVVHTTIQWVIRRPL